MDHIYQQMVNIEQVIIVPTVYGSLATYQAVISRWRHENIVLMKMQMHLALNASRKSR